MGREVKEKKKERDEFFVVISIHLVLSFLLFFLIS